MKPDSKGRTLNSEVLVAGGERVDIGISEGESETVSEKLDGKE